MKRNRSMESKIGCPFLQSMDEEKRELRCEGLVKGSTIRQQFRSQTDLHEFVLSKCEGMCFKACPLYCAVMKERYHEDP